VTPLSTVPGQALSPPAPPAYASAWIAAYRPANMAVVSSAKTLGGVGCILLLLAFAPAVGGLLALTGLVLVLVAMRRLSKGLGEPSIADNSLYAVVAAVEGTVAGTLLVVASLLALVGVDSLSGIDWGKAGPTHPQIAGLAASFVLGLAAVWVAFVLSALFVKRATDKVADRLAIPMFRTAGTAYLVGAALTVLGVGFLLIFVAAIMFAVAFFSIPQTAPTPPAQPV
jgi:uncharacterized membrane protein